EILVFGIFRLGCEYHNGLGWGAPGRRPIRTQREETIEDNPINTRKGTSGNGLISLQSAE
ncbi:unnamed protein product, partial [Ectocarpus sp. 13 AM-2016]